MNSPLWNAFHKTEAYRKIWHNLQTRKCDLDYETARFAHNLRGEFAPGVAGDEDFINWASNKLYDAKSVDLLLMARTFKKIKPANAKEWKELGGWKELRQTKTLSARHQQQIISGAKASGVTVGKVMRSTGILPQKCHQAYKSDVKTLAVYLNKHGGSLPADIRAIVNKYL